MSVRDLKSRDFKSHTGSITATDTIKQGLPKGGFFVAERFGPNTDHSDKNSTSCTQIHPFDELQR